MIRLLLATTLFMLSAEAAFGRPIFNIGIQNTAGDDIYSAPLFDETFLSSGTELDETLFSEQEGFVAQTTLRISESTGEVSIRAVHARTDAIDGFVASIVGITFYADQEYAYSLQGQYAEIIPSSMWMGAVFEFGYAVPAPIPGDDPGDDAYHHLFTHRQVSYLDSTDRLVLGALDDGYTQNDIAGSIEGTIPAGVNVGLSLFVGLRNFPGYLAGESSAEGEWVLTFVPIPEPSVGLLIAGGLAFLSWPRAGSRRRPGRFAKGSR